MGSDQIALTTGTDQHIETLEKANEELTEIIHKLLAVLEGKTPDGRLLCASDDKDDVQLADLLPLLDLSCIPLNMHDMVKEICNVVRRKLVLRGPLFPCPICRTELKLYKRKLNSGMARGLIMLQKLHDKNPAQEWVHVGGSQTFHHKEIEKWTWWDLVEKREERKDATGTKGGFWKLTKLGRDFVAGQTEVPEHVMELLNRPIRKSAATRNIQAALGDRFDFFDLMQASFEDIDAIKPKVKAEKIQAKKTPESC